AQLVEHNLAKVGVASSSLVSRSNPPSLHSQALFDSIKATHCIVGAATGAPAGSSLFPVPITFLRYIAFCAGFF
ncbi:hypothetical protein, partial [Marinobacterium alkalitolerans]|uniref:hypothetical protein n=1 Tax=Marinobacterium alkalitolerans TaxID=1542925 RepID=UPI001ADD89BF